MRIIHICVNSSKNIYATEDTWSSCMGNIDAHAQLHRTHDVGSPFRAALITCVIR